MGNITKNMDSVFDGSIEDTSTFDVIFDQEDSLIDTVCGVDEAGNPLTGVDFDTLHQTHDDATANDVKDVEANDDKFGAPNPEGTKGATVDDNSVKGEVGKESDGDKVRKDADQNYQDGKEGKEVKPDQDNLNDTIEKVAESDDIDSEMMDDDDDLEEGCGGKKKSTCESSSVDVDDDEDAFNMAEGCGKKKCSEAADSDGAAEEYDSENDVTIGDGCKDNFLDSIEDEIKKEGDKTFKESGVDSDVAAIDNADVDQEDDYIDAAEGNPSQSMSSKYGYDVSDEDLIDMAINS